jgi:hypothetical protein
MIMCSLSAKKLFSLEDVYMKQPGLYTMWTILYLINLICLVTDSTTGSIRDFNIASSLLSTVYTSVSTLNTVYGNRKSSTMLLTAGPIHQYSTWLLLAYHGGNVYSTTPLGVLNGVYTVVVGIFTLDMVIKTWVVAVYPDYYLNYLLDDDNNT